MAKALVGHLQLQSRDAARLAAENRALRQRVVDLEALVVRLMAEAEEREAEQREAAAEDLQPA